MNVRQVKKKIKSISNVKKITKAMEMISGIKMKKAQTLEIEGRPYRNALQSIIEKIIPGVNAESSPLVKPPKRTEKDKTLCIFITANKGLCGAFNVTLFRFLLREFDYKSSDFINLGKKGSGFVGKMGRPIVADFSGSAGLSEVSAIFNLALTKFLSEEYSQVVIIYTKFISTLKSEAKMEVLLPISLDFSQPGETKAKKIGGDYLVEPSPNEILDYVLRSYVEEKIRGAIISSEAVEHSARMIAMKNATDNANDVIYNFTLLGNKLRQEKITNELLDMVTAKESVESN